MSAIAVDLVAPGGSEDLIRAAVPTHGRLDVLVNNVGGVTLRLDGFLSVSDEEFERSLQLNFFAALRVTRAAVAHMIEHGGGTIVNVASVNSFYHPDGLVIDYGVAKAALLNSRRPSRKNSATSKRCDPVFLASRRRETGAQPSCSASPMSRPPGPRM